MFKLLNIYIVLGLLSLSFAYNLVDRVFYGKPLSPDVEKYVVKLDIGTSLCSGSIVTTRWIISAAHCFETGNKFSRDITVIHNSRGNIAEIETYFKHPQYTGKLDGHFITVSDSSVDIALLKTKQGITFDFFVSAIKLAKHVPLAPQSGIIAGFGDTETGSYGLPRKGDVIVSVCMEKTLCSRGIIGGGQGDSGGPLVVNHRIAGIVSSGTCKIGVQNKCWTYYANIAFSNSWIERVMAEN